MYFPIDQYHQRWSKTYQAITHAGFETAVVFQKTGGSFDRAGHGLWLTNYASLASGQEPRADNDSGGRSFAAVILHAGHEPELWINEPVEVTDTSRIATTNITYHPNLFAGVGERIKNLGCERVIYVGDDLVPIGYFRDLTAASPGVDWVPDDFLLTEPQLIKSPAELDAYRECGAIASQALTSMTEALIAGKTEAESASLAAAVIVAAGGGIQRLAINHGPKAEMFFWSDPFYGFSTEAPNNGDLVRTWVYGPISRGLWIDPGRTAVCGNSPTTAQRDLIEDCLKVIDAVIDNTRPGVTPRHVGQQTDAVAETVGYFDHPSGAIWDVYGHGLSYYFSPPVAPAGASRLVGVIPPRYLPDRPYEAGMVVSSEAFLARPGVGSATFEEIFIVTDTGPELITTTPRIYW